MKRWPWYLPLFAAYPALYIAVSNPGQAEALTVVAVTSLLALAGACLYLVLRALRIAPPAAGLGAVWVVFLFYAYGPVNEWWLAFAAHGGEPRAAGSAWYQLTPQAVQTLAWSAFAIAGVFAIARLAPRIPDRLRAGLNVVAGLLAASLAVQALAGGLTAPAAKPAPARADASVRDAGAHPDIYFILLDGYARADVLSQYYAFDNSAFLDGLRRRGFQVATASRANYSWTFLSLSSMLNFDYVQSLLPAPIDPASRKRQPYYRLLRDNRAARFLRARGYRTVHLQSTWGGTGSNVYVDEFLPCHSGLFTDEYLRAVADVSWLRAFATDASMDLASCHLRNFDTLAAQGKAPGPKFVFAHFVPPHHPYLFDRDGRVLRHATVSDQFQFQKKLWEERAAYRDQLQFVNRRIEAVIDRLIADSPRPPVILLVSDHGPNLQEGISRFEERRIRLANLTALYLPDAPDGLVPDDATPVNHFRRVFDFYFDARLPLLPDRYFVSTYTWPLAFEEVGADARPLSAQAPGF